MKLLFLLCCLSVLWPFSVHASAILEDAFSPYQGATELVVKTVSDAKSSVHVAAYTFTSKPIADALVAAHNRGVDVEVVLDKRQRTSNRSVCGFLKSSGIPTRFNTHYAIMHDKFMIIDSEVLESGSFNFTKSAEAKNAENVLVVHGDPKVISDYNAQWEKLWNEAEE